MLKRIVFLSVFLVLSVSALLIYFNNQQIKRTIIKFLGKDMHRKVYLLSLKNNELNSFHWSPGVCINELSFIGKHKNDSIFSWIELYNSGNEPYNLAGHYLMVKGIETEEWVFPNRNILPRGYLLIFLSGLDSCNYYSDLHTSFTVAPVDSLVFGKIVNGSRKILDGISIPNDVMKDSYSRIPDGKAFGIAQSTPGIANNKAGIVLMLDDKRIDNHIEYRQLFNKFGARFTFDINASYRCQFHSKDNNFGLHADFGKSLSDEQIKNYKNLIYDGHELGNHHYNHISADDYLKKFGEIDYMRNQIYSMDSVFEINDLPRIKSFVYSNHKRNAETDELLKLRYYNFRGVSSDTLQFKWQNERLLSGFRLDHRAEQPEFLYEILFNIMPKLIKNENVAIMWGHGVTDLYEPVNFYTSDRALSILIQRARELGLKFYTQSELYSSVNPIEMTFHMTDSARKIYSNEDFPFVSLKNTSDFPIDLKGFYLNKNRSADNIYQITSTIVLETDESSKFYFSGLDSVFSKNEIHLNFQLDPTDRIYLLWPDNQTILCRKLVGQEIFLTSQVINIPSGSMLTVSVFDQKGFRLPNEDFEWFSSDDNIFTVDQTGVLKSANKGAAEVALKSKFTGKVLKINVIAL